MPAMASTPDALEVHGISRKLAAFVTLRQAGRDVLPDVEHRALGRVALMANISRHGGDVARLHRHSRPRRPGVLVADVPDNFVGQLNEPLHAIVAMEYRQDELLGG